MGQDIYDPEFVADLFDRCSAPYRRWSAVASFGMIAWWRRACVRALPAETDPEGVFVDLMAGTGEVWPHLLRRYPKAGRIQALDISGEMHRQAVERLHGARADRISHIQADALTEDLPNGAADCVISTFGLKTLNADQQRQLARQVATLLKPGGTFSLIEASDPVDWWLRPLYRVYMDRCLPLIERLFLNGAQDFAMIGTYTKNFGNCTGFAVALRAEGLEVRQARYFFGCATGVSGRKP